MKKQYMLLMTVLVASALHGLTIREIMHDLDATDTLLRIEGLEVSTNQSEQMECLAEWDKSFAIAKNNLTKLASDTYLKNSAALLDAANTQLRSVIKSLITLKLSAADLTKLTDLVKNIAIKVDESTKAVTQSQVTAAVSLAMAMQKSLKRIVATVNVIIDRKKRAVAPPALPPRGTR